MDDDIARHGDLDVAPGDVAAAVLRGDQLGQGKENARQFLKDNPDLADEIDRKIKAKLGIGVQPAAEDLPAGVDPVTGEVSVDF